MRSTGTGRWLAAVTVAGAVALLAAACGGGSDDNGGGDEPTKPAATAPASGTASHEEPTGTVNLVAKDTLWDTLELHAKAGTVTFNVDNQDAGIVHNLHIYKGEDTKGEDLGMTELEAGVIEQQLVLELAAGDYFFTCDAHPATMSGKLEVE